MPDTPSQSRPHAPREEIVSRSETTTLDLWVRLAESIEKLRTVGRRESDPAALARKLAERAKAYRHRAAGEAAEESLAFLAFTKGGQRYGVPLAHVLEVQTLEQFSHVPHAPPFIPGLMQWRGAILALIDLGRLFEFAETGLADVHHCVIVEASGRRVAVAAGEIEEIHSAPLSRLAAAPLLSSKVPPEWIRGVYNHDRLVLKMDSILQDAAFAASVSTSAKRV